MLISLTIFNKEYSRATVSRCNRAFQWEYIQWTNPSIPKTIFYLFLDAVNLKIRHHWLSRESLLCANGIFEDGEMEFFGFISGERESSQTWESLLLMLHRAWTFAKTFEISDN